MSSEGPGEKELTIEAKLKEIKRVSLLFLKENKEKDSDEGDFGPEVLEEETLPAANIISQVLAFIAISFTFLAVLVLFNFSPHIK